MSRIIEFKIPTTTGTETAKGIPLWLKIGERRIKFVLQQDSKGKARWLTHLASGQIFGTLDNAATELMCRLSPYHKFSKRQLAEWLIQKTITRMGVDKVLSKLDSVPVIN